MRGFYLVRWGVVLATVAGMTGCVGVTGESGAKGPGSALLEANPTSISFGQVAEGTSASQAVSIVNNGTASATIEKVVATGPGFSVTGIALPAAVPAGTSVDMRVVFAPSASGAASGDVAIATSARSSPIVIGLKGTGATVTLTATPASATFNNVVAGATASQNVELKAAGAANVEITKITTTGAGFAVSGLAVPLQISPGKTVSFTASFNPTAAGNNSGGISIASNAEGSPLKIALNGTSVKAVATLSVSPTSLAFGGMTVGNSKSEQVTVKNTGNVDVTISKITVTGAGFQVSSGGGTNIRLTPSQQHAVAVTFAPTSAGNSNGTMAFVNTAMSAALQVPLSGSTTNAAAGQHSVALRWTASTSTSVVGYYIYRSSQAEGPFSKLNPSAEVSTTYEDSGVVGGATYYYVVTAVNAEQMESAASNQVSVNVPN